MCSTLLSSKRRSDHFGLVTQLVMCIVASMTRSMKMHLYIDRHGIAHALVHLCSAPLRVFAAVLFTLQKTHATYALLAILAFASSMVDMPHFNEVCKTTASVFMTSSFICMMMPRKQ